MRIRHKVCDRCTQASPMLYRVRYDDSGQWQLICYACYPQVLLILAMKLSGGGALRAPPPLNFIAGLSNALSPNQPKQPP